MVIDTVYKKMLNRDDDHDHDHDHDSDHGDSTVLAKTVAMCVLFLASMILGLLPLQLSRCFKWQTNPKNNIYVNLLLCFGGGILLCTTFLHLLPEVTESVAELQENGSLPEVRFHFSELLMCIGFFTMYFVEECVHVYLNSKQKTLDLKAFSRTFSIRRGDNGDTDAISANNTMKKMEEATIQDNQDFTHDHSHVGHSHLILEDTVVKSIRGLLVVVALSVHELFEGLAVGLESSASTVWYMFGAVSAHKLVIAFCIGVELITIRTKTILVVLYVFTFAVVSPIGIGVGIAVTDGNGTEVPSVILRGLACGTLLYIVFFEIIKKDQQGGLLQFLSILVGFLIMFGLTVLTAHEHSHSHNHQDETTTHITFYKLN
ncbi:hypothetical protein AMK59_3797 [Oryctes borbonicus]|uniref:Zinc/iron permease n=1 Tax=Oryctes borbonicus TaxID=1629725 RepID=A0A0T6B976_9SCAR|nr:hypothetical protein AMK59_3797 [Oryctes borbonicus]